MKMPLKFKYFTAKPNTKAALFLYGEWIELYPQETMLAHESYTEYLETCGVIPCNGPSVYKTIKELNKCSQKNRKVKITE